ncbi:cytochrome P450 [Mangrovihabitans endophyticus]|nr:cytochrome P450 [Mangrovihabitans endophyticus]
MKPLAEALSDMMLFNEPPRHERLRGMMKPVLTPRFVRQMRPAIQGIATALLNRLADAGEMDVIADYARPLSRDVIALLAGVPADARHLLDDWRGLLHEFFTQSTAEHGRIESLRAVFQQGLAQRRAGADGDLLEQLMAARKAGAAFTDDEIIANLLLLIDAGQATTTHLIGNAVLALMAHPDQADLLRDQPELLPGAVHEFLRYDSSVQFTTRIALADLEYGGHRIRRGDSVTLVLGAGNRDPRHYSDPDSLLVTRRAGDHLSFGHGIHYCLGAALSLVEIEAAIGTLLARTRQWRLLDENPPWLDSINFRFLTALPISFSPAAGRATELQEVTRDG